MNHSCTRFSSGRCRRKLISLVGIVLIGLLRISPGLTRLEGAVVVPACPCTLTWILSTSTNVTGYAVYYGIVGSSVTNCQMMGITNTVTLFNLTASANYFFYVVACDAGQDSPPSNVINYAPPVVSKMTLTSPAHRTINLQFLAAPGTACQVQYTTLLAPAQWQTLGSATADSNGIVVITDPVSTTAPSRYYRAVVQ